jgi:putative acetyltransferase
MVSIREEKPEDVPGIRRVNELAFGQPGEADLVDKLRDACDRLVSLVAVEGDEIIGHILFSPAVVESEKGVITGMGLAPMAVLPKHQQQGIGFALVERGLSMMRELSCPFVVVLGHPEYYPRFGFTPASTCDLKCQWEGVPDEAFMVIIFDQDVMKDIRGVARYRDEFTEAR